jgi:hypothetical protein
MLTTQESLEALAGRSPDGKPLVFVSQQDYDALRKQYESLLETTKQSKPYWRSQAAWAMAIAAIGIVIVVAVAYHPVALARVEPYGGGFYTANDVAGVRAANAFCMARKEGKEMRPLYPLGASGIFFECIKSANEVAADNREAARKEAELWQFLPSEENRARCIELRNQMKQAEAANKGLVGTEALLDAVIKAEKLEAEAETLKCWKKP